MSTNFPTSLDSFINPLPTDDVSIVSHSTQHTHINDAMAAVEAKIGINGSLVTTSFDYRIAALEAAATGVSSVSSAVGDSSLTISPTAGAVKAKINMANANSWTATQTITAAIALAAMGAVGIGLTSPLAPLHIVADPTTVSGNVIAYAAMIPLNTNKDGALALGSTRSSTTQWWQLQSGTSAPDNSFSLRDMGTGGNNDQYLRIASRQDAAGRGGETIWSPGTSTITTGTAVGFTLSRVYNQAAATTANTDLLISRTQTAVGSGAQYFIDMQVGGASRLRALTSGQISWNTGLGAINNLFGASDQTFTITTNSPGSGNGPAITIQPGNAPNLAGALNLTGATQTNNSAGLFGGAVNITSGGASSSGTSGAVNISVGTAGTQMGAINIFTPNSASNAIGSINITTGTKSAATAPTSNVGGPFIVQLGAGADGQGAANSTGGIYSVTGGRGGISLGALSSNGSPMTWTGGAGGSNAAATGQGGDAGAMQIIGATGGAASGVTSATGGKGTTVLLVGGAGGAATGAAPTRIGGDAGNLVYRTLAGGAGAVAGADGTHIFQTAGTTTRVIINNTALSLAVSTVLRTGTAAASTAPLYFTAGTNLTAAINGAMEYDGTNLFFTRAATTREYIMTASAATPPATTPTPVFTNYYGGNTNALGNPVAWRSYVEGGTTYKIPLYT